MQIALYADCIGRSLLHWLALVLWIDNIGTLIGTVERSGIVVVYNHVYIEICNGPSQREYS